MKIACFTGHRPNKLYGYDDRSKYSELVKTMESDIEYMVRELEVDTFISGGAQGIDQLAFWAVEHVKRRFDFVNNTVYVPFVGQQNRWSQSGAFGQRDYATMLRRADNVVYLERELTAYKDVAKALNDRNERMVNDSDYVLAYGIIHDICCDTGGTANCIRYAIQKNKLYQVRNPLTCITYELMSNDPY